MESDTPNLGGLHCTLAGASEVLAAFVSMARSDERPLDSGWEARSKSVQELAEWRSTLTQLVEIYGQQTQVH